jgi:hypothetical protein
MRVGVKVRGRYKDITGECVNRRERENRGEWHL